VKIIKPKVLISKVNALLQLSTQVSESQSKVLELGDLIIDKDNFKVTKAGENLLLPKKEFDLLYLLASNTQKVFKREEILDKVWGNDVIVGERTIDVHIRRLREKLGDNSIQTLKGIGYKLTV
jgi:two-component system alkaline phosphatase synthesis response regulator PhoP